MTELAADITPNELRVVQHDGEAFTVVNLNGSYYAFSDICTHRGCELHEGKIVADTQVQCPCHGARYEMTTGQVLAGPTQQGLKTVPVSVQDGKLVLG